MRRKASTSRLVLLASVAFLSIFLLSLSWPRLQASLRFLPVDIGMARYYRDQQIPTDRLAVLIRFALEAIGHHDHYRYHNGLSLLHYLRALDVYTPARERRDAYRQAEAAAMASLSQAPAQPAAWLRLSTIRWILHDEPEAIIQPWKMSIFTGRTHSSLYTHRVEVGLAQRAFLDDEGVAMLRDQLLLAWKTRPGTLIQVLARRDRKLLKTGGLLEFTDPEALEEMEAWLERIR